MTEVETISYKEFAIRFRCHIPFTGFVDNVGYAFVNQNIDGTYQQSLDIRYGIEKIQREVSDSIRGNSANKEQNNALFNHEFPVAARDATYTHREETIKAVATEKIILLELQKLFCKIHDLLPEETCNAVAAVSNANAIVDYSMSKSLDKELRLSGVKEYHFDWKLGRYVVDRTDMLYAPGYNAQMPSSVRKPFSPVFRGFMSGQKAAAISSVSKFVGKACVVVSLALIFSDAASCGEFQKHHALDLALLGIGTAIGIAVPIAGLVFGLVYLVSDVASQYYTGKTITELICGEGNRDTPTMVVPSTTYSGPVFRQGR